MPRQIRTRISGWLSKLVFKFSIASFVGMFLVLLMGSLVTKTESGRGCGDDWPLCNGKFVPAYTIESLFEWSHRFVSAVVGLIVLATFILVLIYSKKIEAKLYSGSILFFTVVQAIMGAFAVVWPQSSAVLALHFGLSLLAFASTVLLLLALRQERREKDGVIPTSTQIDRSRFRYLVWAVLVYCYAVVYLGAYVRHTNSSGGCGRNWPLCDGAIIPDLSGATGIVFLHRIGAILLFIMLLWVHLLSRKTKQSARIQYVSKVTFYLVTIQIFSGAFVTYSLGTDWYLLAALVHVLLISGLFAALCHLAILVGRTPRR